MNRNENAALLIVGHGSTVNPDSSAPTLRHAAAIRHRGIFAEVACCFWKEEPSLRDALFFFRDPAIRDVYVVPNFISEGYFTRTVIPRELELSGPETERANGQAWKYCPPVGSHETMTDHLLEHAREIAPGVSEQEMALLIVAHGTSLNDNSAVAAKEQVEKIRRLGRYAEVLNVYMEEPPLVSDWVKLTKSKNVVVVPFFISDGLHSYEDIPALLGIEPEARPAAGPQQAEARPSAHPLQGRSLFYSTAIGTDSRFADVIIEQARAFDRKQVLQSAS
ncbi:MAG TPA: CbiX/SirB N-terminal domain-containing protein [Chthoniobacterales bacterium]|nr:CbiX/SirB N-terminal domain-containing protein [Chthoniobacterales bacterium]